MASLSSQSRAATGQKNNGFSGYLRKSMVPHATGPSHGLVGWGIRLSWTPFSDHGPTEKYFTSQGSLPQAPRLWRWKADLPDWLTSVEMIRLPWRPPPLYSFPVFLGDLEIPYGSHLQLVLEEASFPHHTLLMWSGSPSPNRWGWGQGLPSAGLPSLHPSFGLCPFSASSSPNTSGLSIPDPRTQGTVVWTGTDCCLD